MKPTLSLVIPVYNEAESLGELLAEIARHAPTAEWEAIFVDDGSTDDSWAIIEALAATEPRVRGVRLRRNFGKAAALAAGFAAARAERVAMLDADLQDDPAELPALVAALADADLVCGWKQVRHDQRHKTLPSRVFNALVSAATGVRLHDHNCGYKAMTAEVARGLPLHGELHRFIPVFAASRGFRVAERAVHHRARKYGRSKYGWRRFLRGLFDLSTALFLTKYGQRPLHFFGLLALGAAALALGTAAWAVRQGSGPAGAAAAAFGALAVGLYALGLKAELVAAAPGTPRAFEIAATVGLESAAKRPAP